MSKLVIWGLKIKIHEQITVGQTDKRADKRRRWADKWRHSLNWLGNDRRNYSECIAAIKVRLSSNPSGCCKQ